MQFHRVRWIAVGVLAVVVTITVGISAYFLFRQRSEIRHDEVLLHATCTVARDIGTAPVSVNPATGKPTVLGVKIIADFRNAFINQECPGKLPPADPTLVYWARRFHVPLDRR